MKNKLLSISLIICLWQSNLAAPLSGDAIALQELIGDKMQQMLKDTEEALGISMRTYNVYVVESFNHAIRDRNIEDLAAVCEILIKQEASNVNLTPEQREDIEPFFVQLSNRTKVLPDPLEIAETFLICNYLQNPIAYRAADVSVSEFLEIEAIKNSIPITRRLCRLNNKMQGISFFAPQESDQLTNNQLREYKMILSNGVKTVLLERAVWDREVCVYLNETISTEEYVKLLDITMYQYKTLSEDTLSLLGGDLGGLYKICDAFNPPPDGMLTIIKMDKLMQDPNPIFKETIGLVMSNSLKDKISGIRATCSAITEYQKKTIVRDRNLFF